MGATSDAANIPFVVGELQRLKPASVLDVGVGFGKWGFLAREYLEVFYGRVHRPQWKVCVDGIEAFGRYRNPVWDWAYDEVHVGDVRQLLPGLGRYDVALMCDVIEHLDKAAGKRSCGSC